MSKMVHVSSQKDMPGMYDILACKFNVLEKKSHSLLDDPRTIHKIMYIVKSAEK